MRILANETAFLSGGCVPIIGADPAPKKVCFEKAPSLILYVPNPIPPTSYL